MSEDFDSVASEAAAADTLEDRFDLGLRSSDVFAVNGIEYRLQRGAGQTGRISVGTIEPDFHIRVFHSSEILEASSGSR